MGHSSILKTWGLVYPWTTTIKQQRKDPQRVAEDEANTRETNTLLASHGRPISNKWRLPAIPIIQQLGRSLVRVLSGVRGLAGSLRLPIVTPRGNGGLPQHEYVN